VETRRTIRGANKGLCALLALMGFSCTPALATTTYHVQILSNGPACGAKFVIDLLSSDGITNEARIFGYTSNGGRDSVETWGGPVSGPLVGEGSGSDSTIIEDRWFENRLTILSDSLGTVVNFGINLTESAPADTIGPDQLSMYYVRRAEATPMPSDDPLGAEALFAIDITGVSGGVLTAYTPAVYRSADSIIVDLRWFCPTGGGGGCENPPCEIEDELGSGGDDQSAAGGVREEQIDFPLALEHPRPSPSQGRTTITWSVPKAEEGHPFELSLFDVAGRKVLTLEQGIATAGKFRKELSLDRAPGVRLRNGVFFLRLNVGSNSIRRTLVFAR